MNDEIPKLIEKASHAIRSAEILYEEGELDSASSRAYYALFYLAEALLLQDGEIRLKKHSAVHSLFGEKLAKTGKVDTKFHRWLIDAFDKRIKGDYDVESLIDEQDVEEMIAHAKEFSSFVNQYIAN